MNRTILHWSYRDFREFPSELIEYGDSVEELYLKENFIPIMPKWLFQFVHLRFMQLSGNTIESIDDAISELKNLEYLDFSKNRLTDLPQTIIQLNKLQYLNVSDNKISSFNKGFGQMKMLTTLNFSKNCLAQIPLELAESKTLTDLFLNDNLLCEIPAKIVSMPSLRVLEAERCLLKYLPGIISNHLIHIRFFNNSRLTHYPAIYEKFLCLHYDYWSESVVSADLLMIFLPDNNRKAIIPQGIELIQTENSPSSLSEFALRTIYQNEYLSDNVCKNVSNLPHKLLHRIKSGPVCKCGNIECNIPLFTECHFSLMKKKHSPSHIIFSSMFCSKKCLSIFHSSKKNYLPFNDYVI